MNVLNQKASIFCLAAAVLLSAGAAAHAAVANEAAGDILAKTDAIRNPQHSFVADVSLIDYKNGSETDRAFVTTHSRQENKAEQFQSLVYIDIPSRDKGKIVLRNGNLIWFYDPASKASVRLSPRQRLIGNASNGDVITANFALDYSAELTGEEEITDGDRQPRTTYRLHLTSRNETTPYDRIDFWVDKANYRPIRGKFYTNSGRLLKVAWYRGWEEVLGETRPTEVVIANGVDPKHVTVMKLSNFRPRDLPQSWFSKSWLPRFRKQ